MFIKLGYFSWGRCSEKWESLKAMAKQIEAHLVQPGIWIFISSSKRTTMTRMQTSVALQKTLYHCDEQCLGNHQTVRRLAFYLFKGWSACRILKLELDTKSHLLGGKVWGCWTSQMCIFTRTAFVAPLYTIPTCSFHLSPATAGNQI